MNEDLKRNVTKSLDGNNADIYPFLPYILQDIENIGASPKIILDLIRLHIAVKKAPKRVIDLGCGKGQISIEIAKEFAYSVFGIDAIEDFIEEARRKAIERDVLNFVKFEQGDIRDAISYLEGYDIAILAAIGNAMGNMEFTLQKVRKILNPKGYIILDEAFSKNEPKQISAYISESDFEKIIYKLNLMIIDEKKLDEIEFEEINSQILKMIRIRTNELIKKHPKKESLFNAYYDNQLKETNILENEVECKTILLRKM